MQDQNSHDGAEPSTEHWILVADQREARLLSGVLTSHGRLHIEPRSTLHEEWDEHQHGRPSPRASKDGHGYASIGHEDEERAQRFAREVAKWLQAEIESSGIQALHAFCAPKMLGSLRKVLPSRLRHLVREHATDLSRLSPGDLATHSTVLMALQGDGSLA